MVTASSASKGRLSQGSLVEGDTEESQVVSRVAVATKTISSIIIQQNWRDKRVAEEADRVNEEGRQKDANLPQFQDDEFGNVQERQANQRSDGYRQPCIRQVKSQLDQLNKSRLLFSMP